MQDNNQSLEKFINRTRAVDKHFKTLYIAVFAIALLIVAYKATEPNQGDRSKVTSTLTPALTVTPNASR